MYIERAILKRALVIIIFVAMGLAIPGPVMAQMGEWKYKVVNNADVAVKVVLNWVPGTGRTEQRIEAGSYKDWQSAYPYHVWNIGITVAPPINREIYIQDLTASSSSSWNKTLVFTITQPAKDTYNVTQTMTGL